MNKARRKEIAEIFNTLELLVERLDNVISEEQDYYDKMPDSLQQGEKGSAVEESIENLTEAHTNLTDAQETISNFI